MIPALPFLSGLALAVTPDELEATLLAAEPYRAQRVAQGPPVIPMAQMKRTADGNVVSGLLAVPGSAAGKAYAAAIVDVPIATMWSAINDETRLPGWNSVAYAELLVGQPCVDGRRVLQYIDIPWVEDRWWIGVPKQNRTLLRNSGGSVREMTFSSSTNPAEVTSASGQKILGIAVPIAFSKGGWFLVAADARSTYVEYYVWSDPGPGIPTSITSSLATKGVRDNIAAIAKFAKEGKPSCPLE